MKIILAHYKYYVQGGPEQYMFKFMELARKHNCEVIPFSVNFPTNVKSNYSSYFVGKENDGGNYDPSNHNISYLVKNVYHEFHNKEAYKKLRKLIKKENPDLLYVLIPGQLTTDIFKAAKKEKIPVILRISDFRMICGMYSMIRNGEVCEKCVGGKYYNCRKYKCVKNSTLLSTLRSISLSYNRKHHRYNNVDGIITPPSFTKELLVRDGQIKENKIFVNPTFIDFEKIQPSFTHQNYILCLGRFAPEKGVQYAVEAMKYLKDTPLKLYVTGDKNNVDERIQKIIDENDLLSKIEFIGFLKGKELEETIQNAFTIIAPAIWYENMPNTVLEAYAYGKPVIGSNLGSLSEIIEDGKTGYLFEPKNSKELSEKILKLFNDEKIYLQMCANARKKCEEDFSPEKHWNIFLDIYNKVR